MSLVLQFELILKIGSIKCAYGGRQKNISRAPWPPWAPRWTGLLCVLKLALTSPVRNCERASGRITIVYKRTSSQCGKKKRYSSWDLQMAGCMPSEVRSGEKSYVCLEKTPSGDNRSKKQWKRSREW
jgi:hypothetical protein